MFGAAPADHLLFTAAAAKMKLPIDQLFFRGILCNWLVCLAIWTAMRAKEEIAAGIDMVDAVCLYRHWI